jgi:hypothetical protein
MTEKPQTGAQAQGTAQEAAQGTAAGAAQVPPQSRGQDQITPPAAASSATHRRETPEAETSGWVGWVVFGAMMMLMVGSFQAIVGLTALFQSEYYVVSESGLLLNVDFTAWGWTHLILGAVAVAAGAGLLAGQMWARVVGIAMALVSAVVNLAFIAAYPLWSMLIIALDVLVIYAVAMHGGDLRSRTRSGERTATAG